MPPRMSMCAGVRVGVGGWGALPLLSQVPPGALPQADTRSSTMMIRTIIFTWEADTCGSRTCHSFRKEPQAKNLCSQSWGLGLIPGQGTRSHMPQ